MPTVLQRLHSLKYTLAYIAMIPLINILIPILPLFDFGNGVKMTPVSLIVGVIYILRDFAQKEIGRKHIFLAMGIAATITYFLANPAQALASLTAFLCGELIDWAVFSYSKRPLSQRVLISNAIALPVDIIIVLIGLHIAMPGFLPINLVNMLIMFSCNMVSAIIVFLILRKHEQKQQIST